MTTTRDFVDSWLHCPIDGKRLEIKPELDDTGAEIHACMQCNYRERVDQAGFVTELDPAPIVWPTQPCYKCGADVIWCTTVNYRPMPVDPAPSPYGVFSLHSVAGAVQAQYDYGHRIRRLYSHHSKTCTGKQATS